MSKEKINHPDHYQSGEGIEVIDVIDAFTAGLDGVQAFDLGNAIKYILRAPKKNGVEDLKKAKWYINHLIATLECEDMEEDDCDATTDDAPVSDVLRDLKVHIDMESVDDELEKMADDILDVVVDYLSESGVDVTLEKITTERSDVNDYKKFKEEK